MCHRRAVEGSAGQGDRAEEQAARKHEDGEGEPDEEIGRREGGDDRGDDQQERLHEATSRESEGLPASRRFLPRLKAPSPRA